MCDLSNKLIARLDHELPPQEAAALQQHVEACQECRRCLAAYKEIGEAIDEFCDSRMESTVRRALPCWTSVLAAAAAVVALLFFFPRTSIEQHPPQIQVAADAPAIVHFETPATVAPTPTRRSARRRRVAASAQVQNVNWIPAEPAIQIAIPADAMFAPGAVPQGVSFSADLTIAADGSAQQLRLRP
jgi:anti-sigma factor RsiW